MSVSLCERGFERDIQREIETEALTSLKRIGCTIANHQQQGPSRCFQISTVSAIICFPCANSSGLFLQVTRSLQPGSPKPRISCTDRNVCAAEKRRGETDGSTWQGPRKFGAGHLHPAHSPGPKAARGPDLATVRKI